MAPGSVCPSVLTPWENENQFPNYETCALILSLGHGQESPPGPGTVARETLSMDLLKEADCPRGAGKELAAGQIRIQHGRG